MWLVTSRWRMQQFGETASTYAETALQFAESSINPQYVHKREVS